MKKNIIKYILLGLFIFLFCNSMIVNAKETMIRTCKYEKSNLGSSNDIYIEIKFTKNCSGCSVLANIDLEKSHYYDTQYKKFIHFDAVKKINTLQFSQNNTYNNENKDNCPEAIFVGVRDGSWVTVKMGTKAEMQNYSDTNVAIGGYDYHYRDRYVITKTGVLTDGDITAIDNRLIERTTNIKDNYKKYEDKNCPPYSGDLGDTDYLKKWQNSVEIKGKSSDEIKNLLEECKTLKNNLSVLISSAEDDLKDDKDKGYDVNREAAKNLQNSINTIKNIDSSIVVDGSSYNEGTEQYGCNVVPAVVKKWIKVALNFVKYVALVLVIILGTLDFIKAAGSGEPDAMKKAGQSFIKRVVAVIILFLVPMIVDLLLNLIDLFGANTDCFGVLE